MLRKTLFTAAAFGFTLAAPALAQDSEEFFEPPPPEPPPEAMDLPQEEGYEGDYGYPSFGFDDEDGGTSATSGYNPYFEEEEAPSPASGPGPFSGSFSDSKPPADSVARAERIENLELDVPPHQLIRPAVGIEIAASYATGSALPSAADIASSEGEKAHQVSLQIEYQPTFLQDAGVFGIGISGAVNPVKPGGITKNAASIYSVGGQFRYQLKYFRNQPVVPMAGYAAEYWRYSLADDSSGSFLAQGPVVGAWILLNFIDPASATQFYLNHGVVRSYLVAEMRLLSGGDSNVQASGKAYFFGLRFEI